MPYDIITIGAATRDVFLKSKAWEVKSDSASPTGLEQCLPLGAKIPVDDIHFTTGGGATNAAVTFRRMGGLKTACVTRVGAGDSGGAAVVNDLKRERVDTRLIQRDLHRHTGYSLILLSGIGERTILVHRGASEALAETSIPWSRMRTKWFYVTSLAGKMALVKKLLAHAERIGANVAWNPGSRELVRGWNAIAPLARRCAVFNVNREEAAQLTGLKPENLHGILSTLCGACTTSRKTPGRILLTDGARGAYACDGCTVWHIASRNIRATNTTGAGDAFGSAFTLGIMRGMATPDALRLAMANAEGIITHMGAKAGILDHIPRAAALARYTVREV